MTTILKTVVVFCLALLSQGRGFSRERPASLARLRENLQDKVNELMNLVGRSANEVTTSMTTKTPSTLNR